MSMSEFDRLFQEWGEDEAPYSAEPAQNFPEDFSAEDMLFAQELQTLFPVEEDEAPPYFTQTLLEPDKPAYQVVEHRFEQKIHTRVFRRLKLRRRLFRTAPNLLQTAIEGFPKRKPVIALGVACLLFMLMTMMATSSSFAYGMNILITGKHGGVLQTLGYPTGLSKQKHVQTKQTATTSSQPKQISLVEAQQELHFSMYWPSALPNNYALKGVYLHNNVNYTWADGPILELDYRLSRSIASRGIGDITISEFKPQGQVLQVVQLGAAHQIEIDAQGHAKAIYIDGQWKSINKSGHTWSYGTRSELIYEKDGILFWIVGDQRDGINRDALRAVASSLNVFDVQRTLHAVGRMSAIDLPEDNSSWTFANDVVYTDSPSGPLWTTIGNDGSGISTQLHTPVELQRAH